MSPATKEHDPGNKGGVRPLVCVAVVVFVGILALLIPMRAISAPTWWTTRNVIDTNSAPADCAPATLGQLKNVAAKAYDELQTNLESGPGSTLSNLVFGFANSNNYAAVTLGQLQNIAKPFYDRIAAAGYTNALPWTTNTADDADYAPANIGQLKRVFDFTLDTDGDSMPDWWENQYGLDPATNDGALDPDQDQLSNSNEYLQGTNPFNFDTDGDLLADGPELAKYGTSPTNWDTDGDGTIDWYDKLFGDPFGPGVQYQILSISTTSGCIDTLTFGPTTSSSTYEFFDITNLFNQTWLLAATAVHGQNGTSTWVDCGGPGRQSAFFRVYRMGLGDDTDHDGLGSAYECLILGTSPDMADSDGDSLSDGDEDPDNDGLVNAAEYNSPLATGYYDPCRQGSSRPDIMDSDGDGVSDGPIGNGSSITNGPDHFPMDPSGWQDTDCDGMPDSLNTNFISTSWPPLQEDLDDDNDGFSDVEEIAAGSDPKSDHSQPPPSMLHVSGKYIVDDQTNKVILKSVNIGSWLAYEQWMTAFQPKAFTNALNRVSTNNGMDEATLRTFLVDNVDFSTNLVATNYSQNSGLSLQNFCTQQPFTNTMGSYSGGDYLRFDNVNCTTAGVSSLSVMIAYAGGSVNPQIEVRVGSPTGTVAGALNVPDSGGWCELSEESVTLTNPISGTQTIYFVGKSTSGDVGNVYRFRLYRDSNTRQLIDTFRANYFMTNDLDNLKALGYNCIRVPFLCGLIQDGNGVIITDGWTRLDGVVRECKKRHMWCILDLHGAPGSQNYFDHSGRPDGMRSMLWTSQVYQARTTDLWAKIAARYSGEAAVAGYDLFNEPDPPTNSSYPTKQVAYTNFILPLQTKLYQSVRSSDTNHVIFMMSNFLDTNVWTEAYTCPAPSSQGWVNVVYEFHEYYRVQYGQTGTNDSLFEIQKAIADQAILAYTRFSEDRQVPVFIGEFMPDKMQNFDYFIRQFEVNGISWANWNFRHWGHDNSDTNFPWSNWGLDYRTGAVYGVVNTAIQPNVRSDSFATLSNKFSQYTAANYAPHPFLQNVIQNAAANTNVPKARTDFYLNTFSGPNQFSLSATNAWPWRKFVTIGSTNDRYIISGGRGRTRLDKGPILLRLKSRDEADARFGVNDSSGSSFSLSIPQVDAPLTVAGPEAEIRVAFVRDAITNGLYKDDSPAVVGLMSYDQSAGSSNVSLLLYSKTGTSNTYGTLKASNTVAYVTGDVLRLEVNVTNAVLSYNGVTSSAPHNADLSAWPGGAIGVMEVEDNGTGATDSVDFDDIRAGRDATAFDASHVNDFTNYPSGLYALAEPEHLSIRTWDRTNEYNNSVLTNSALLCIPERVNSGWNCINPRRDYQNDARFSLASTNVLEARATFSNLTGTYARVCFMPEYFPGQVTNEYKGDAIYAEVSRNGGNLDIVAFRQFDAGTLGRTAIASGTVSYVDGRGVSLQVGATNAQVYYGTSQVFDAPHGLSQITNAFRQGVFPHFEFQNKDAAAGAEAVFGGIRCRTLSDFTIPGE